jgi:hypothetical protein
MRTAIGIIGSGLAAILLIIGLSCSGGTTEAGPCGSSADCGDGEACNQGECVDAACLSSADCDINQFCNPAYKCQEGCEQDSDCVAGEVCGAETHECESYGCRDTNLDCELGEYCDQTTGNCYPSNEGHCDSCDIWDTNSCGPDGSCYYFGGETCFSDSDCPSGQFCDPMGFFCHVDFCFLDCNPNAEDACPRGYSCLDATGMGDNICFADCEWMQENGY